MNTVYKEVRTEEEGDVKEYEDKSSRRSILQQVCRYLRLFFIYLHLYFWTRQMQRWVAPLNIQCLAKVVRGERSVSTLGCCGSCGFICLLWYKREKVWSKKITKKSKIFSDTNLPQWLYFRHLSSSPIEQ